MGEITKRRYMAFSLPETIVAMVIILAVFAMGTMLLTGTGRTGVNVRQLKANSLLQLFADRTQGKRLFISDSETAEGFRLYRMVTAYPGYDSLLLIHFSVVDQNNKLLADWRSLVRGDQ